MTDLGLINIATAVVTLAAIFGYINHRWLKLPTTIGLVVIAMISSLCVIAFDNVFPAVNLRDTARADEDAPAPAGSRSPRSPASSGLPLLSPPVRASGFRPRRAPTLFHPTSTRS